MSQRRLSLKQRRFIDAYLANGGNAARAALEVYDTDAKVARSIGAENLAKPSIRHEIEMRLGNGAIDEAWRVTVEGLHALTANGRPHWVVKLRSADMIFRLAHAYDRSGKEGEAADPQAVIDVDFSTIHPELTRYFAIHKRWPSDEIQHRLENGESLEQIELAGQKNE